MATFDLGLSLAGHSGTGGGGATIEVLIGARLENTLLLSSIVAAISVPLSVTLGLLAAMFPTSLYDRTVTFTTLCLVAVPEFFIATMLCADPRGAAPVAALHRHDDRLRIGVAHACARCPCPS